MASRCPPTHCTRCVHANAGWPQYHTRRRPKAHDDTRRFRVIHVMRVTASRLQVTACGCLSPTHGHDRRPRVEGLSMMKISLPDCGEGCRQCPAPVGDKHRRHSLEPPHTTLSLSGKQERKRETGSREARYGRGYADGGPRCGRVKTPSHALTVLLPEVSGSHERAFRGSLLQEL